MEFLLNLPVPISFLIVSAVPTLFALAGLHFVRKKYSAEVLKENHEVAAIIFNAFGLFYGVMVAFVVFVTWSGYDEATKNLQMEASEALHLFHSAEGFPAPVNKTVQQALRDYVASVYNDEVQRMSHGDISLYSGGAHAEVTKLFSQLGEESIPNRELYAESLRGLSDLAQYRRLRIFAGNDTVPPVIWFVLLIGGAFTVSYTFFFGMKNLKAQYLITATLTVTITLILFLIYVLDHPFTGTSKISMEPLKQVIAELQKP
jgi:Na+/proline symporter